MFVHRMHIPATVHDTAATPKQLNALPGWLIEAAMRVYHSCLSALDCGKACYRVLVHQKNGESLEKKTRHFRDHLFWSHKYHIG